MLRVSRIGLLTLATLVSVAAVCPAQMVVVRTPRVSVTVGPSFLPGISVAVPAQVPVVAAQEPVPLPPPTRLGPVPLVPSSEVAPAPVPLRPMSHYEFAACFKPCPGTHEAILIHPGSGCPVRVCFTLPPGCPRVCLAKRDLIFDYGCKEVAVRFKLFGKVAVYYR